MCIIRPGLRRCCFAKVSLWRACCCWRNIPPRARYIIRPDLAEWHSQDIANYDSCLLFLQLLHRLLSSNGPYVEGSKPANEISRNTGPFTFRVTLTISLVQMIGQVSLHQMERIPLVPPPFPPVKIMLAGTEHTKSLLLSLHLYRYKRKDWLKMSQRAVRNSPQTVRVRVVSKPLKEERA